MYNRPESDSWSNSKKLGKKHRNLKELIQTWERNRTRTGLFFIYLCSFWIDSIMATPQILQGEEDFLLWQSIFESRKGSYFSFYFFLGRGVEFYDYIFS